MGNTVVQQRQPPKSNYDTRPEDWPWVWAIRDGELLDWKTGLTPDQIQETALRQQQLPVRIGNSHLYLGNCQCVENIDRLEELGVKRVLNMAGPFAVKSKTIAGYRRVGIDYLRIDAQDEEGYPLLERHWQEAREFVTADDDQGKCVVHCVAGHNRSALIVAAVYMLLHETSVLETVRLMRYCRGNVALTNESFQEQLVALARHHDLLGPCPGTPGAVVPYSPPVDLRIPGRHF